MHRLVSTILLIAVLSGCGGGERPVELQIEVPTSITGNQVILKGTSFVPAGSICPESSEFIRIGTLGAHSISYTNAATRVTGPVFSDLWVCNSEDGRTFHWTSNPITLLPGANAITVRMSASGRTSESTITVQGNG